MTAPQGHVLVVEDSRMFCATLKERFETHLHLEVTVATNYSEARDLLSREHPDFSVAVLDMNLPDAPEGAVVELVQTEDIPAIVFTSGVSDGFQEDLWDRGIVDYVLKDSTNCLDYLASLVRRINRNRGIETLVVDDSGVMRRRVRRLLEAHQYTVFEADGAASAIGVLGEHPAVKLMLVDYEMPRMAGTELTKQVRHTHSPDDLAIIGLSGSGGQRLSAKFLKSGANDFISKPFAVEEFYCRITQNVELLEHIALISEASNTDYLTGLSNRRGFFELAGKLHANSQRGNLSAALAMFDIDLFKKVNDTYGHDAGDAVLKRIAQVLTRRFRNADVVSRFGGEEFCILATNVTKQQARRLFEGVRRLIEAEEVHFANDTIQVTVSVGVSLACEKPLEEMIRHADENLYKAKEAGRNRIEI